jgi:hypothetical protein
MADKAPKTITHKFAKVKLFHCLTPLYQKIARDFIFTSNLVGMFVNERITLFD